VEGLATTQEVADYLKVKPNTLDHWASDGRGPVYTKIEGSRRYDWADVREWVEARKVRH
jgi:excisionase family DNA binding protein